MSKGLGKIERMVLEMALAWEPKAYKGRLSGGGLSNRLRAEKFGFDKPNAGYLSRSMWIIGAVKSGSRKFTNGRDLTEEELAMHKENESLRDSVSRAYRSLIKKGYFIHIEGEHEWEKDLFVLNHDKCKPLGTIVPNADT